LKGLAKVAAINCDDEDNKPFCGTMGVQGFPTLKIVRPSAKAGGKPMVEDYQGARTAKAIADAVVEKIPNHVKRVTDKSIKNWLKDSNETAKAILFSDKGTTSALLRALAIDFLGNIGVAQVRDKETATIEMFGIEKYPTFVLLPGRDKEAVVYDGELKKDAMVTFLSQIAAPNPDPAPDQPKAKKDTKKDTKRSSKPSKAAKESETGFASGEEKSPEAAESKPVPQGPVIPVLATESELRGKCFTSTSKICALVLLPASSDSDADSVKSIEKVYEKHSRRKASFPFYAVESTNPLTAVLRKALSLENTSGVQLLAVNAKRSWFRKFGGKSYTIDSVEDWVDTIRMNEGKKEKLPEALTTEKTEAPAAQPEAEPAADAPKVDKSTKQEDAPEPEPEEAAKEPKRDVKDEL
jgi:protein disulfide-isomerase A6